MKLLLFFILFSSVANGQYSPIGQNGKYALANPKGKPVTDAVYDTIISIRRATTEQEELFYLGLKEGKVSLLKGVVESEYESPDEPGMIVAVKDTFNLPYFSAGTADLFSEEGKFLAGGLTGLIVRDYSFSTGTSEPRDLFGKPKAPAPNSVLRDYEGWPDIDMNSDLVLIRKNNKWGALNFDGRQVIPLLFDVVEFAQMKDATIIVGVNNGRPQAYDQQGNLLALNYSDPDSDLFLSPVAIKENELVEAVLNNRGDKNFVDDFGMSLLIKAIESNDTQLWQLLIKKGAEGAASPGSLVHAIRLENMDVIRAIMQQKPNVIYADEELLTPVHYAVMSGNEKILNLVLTYVADLSGSNWQGNSPLCFIKKGPTEMEMVKVLSGKKINVNDRCANGDTPLHYAVKTENKELVAFLLELGGDKKAVDHAGKTALHYARELKNEDIISLFSK